jgi:hypothetical protein
MGDRPTRRGNCKSISYIHIKDPTNLLPFIMVSDMFNDGKDNLYPGRQTRSIAQSLGIIGACHGR